jgi:hypothetical protein
MDIDPEQRMRLDRLMDARRLDLNLTWREVAAHAGLSYEALREVRNGPGGTRTLTMRKIDKGLRWTPGSMERTLNGGEPENDPLSREERAGGDALVQQISDGYAAVKRREEQERDDDGKNVSA